GFYLVLLRALDDSSEPLAALGLPGRPRGVRLFGLGFLFGGALVAIAIAIIAVLGSYKLSIFAAPTWWIGLVTQSLILLSGAVGAALALRRYPFPGLVGALGAPFAIALASFFFALLHFANPHVNWFALLNTLVIGILLSLAYLRTRSLWLPWGIHFGWNFVL